MNKRLNPLSNGLFSHLVPENHEVVDAKKGGIQAERLCKLQKKPARLAALPISQGAKRVGRADRHHQRRQSVVEGNDAIDAAVDEEQAVVDAFQFPSPVAQEDANDRRASQNGQRPAQHGQGEQHLLLLLGIQIVRIDKLFVALHPGPSSTMRYTAQNNTVESMH